MAGPVADGGHIVWNSTPGCWGPMITPAIRGGHEVCTPVVRRGRRGRRRDRDPDQGHRRHVARDLVGQRPGDGGPLQRRSVLRGRVSRLRGGVAVDADRGDRRDRRCAARPAAPTRRRSRSPTATRSRSTSRLGVTVDGARAEESRATLRRPPRCPDNSVQNPMLTFAPHHIVGLVTRMRPFLGQLGTSPSTTMPDSHNAGDFGAFLVGAPHKFAIDAQELRTHKTDGHLDIDAVRAGAILVCPVKVPGGGVYLGDMHAMQGDGEIAGHTADVAGHGHAAGRGGEGAGDRRAGAVPARRGPPVPGQAADRRRARAAPRRWPSARASARSRSRCRSPWSAPARTSTPPPTTGSRAPPSCSA